MSATHAIRLVLRRLGLDLQRYRADEHPLARRARLLEARSVATVLDVGANSGQFGRELRELGYRGRIVSFEPLSAAFAALERAARGSPPWEVHRCALGEQPGRASIHVAANSYSSSLLAMQRGARSFHLKPLKTEALNLLFSDILEFDNKFTKQILIVIIFIIIVNT